ncbi:SAV_915 family protein [Sphaerisporangium sp. NPDC004334]
MGDPLLVVPVREGTATVSLRLFRTAAGVRTAVAFSSPLALARVLGPAQRWIRLSAPALRHMVADLGVTGIVLDPAGTLPPRSAATGHDVHRLRVA